MRAWRPGRDPNAVRHPAAQNGDGSLSGSHPVAQNGDGSRSGSPPAVNRNRNRPHSGSQAPTVAVVGGGIAGLAAATGLAERGVRVVLLEAADSLGGRVRAWPVPLPGGEAGTMSRGFHAFFRQYYNLRALLRRADPGLDRLVPLADYPLRLAPAGGRDAVVDSFAKVPRTPPWNLVGFVAQSPSFRVADLTKVDVREALGLLRVAFPRTYSELDGVSAAAFLDRLRFPDSARHLALEVFARSFFADPREFAAGELVAMFHTYFVGSAEGLLFDVPDDDYDTALWAPLGRYLAGRGVDVRTGTRVTGLAERDGRLVLATPDADVAADAVVLALDTRALQGLVAGAAEWGRHTGGTVVEVHGYALADTSADTRDELWRQAERVYPELVGAKVLAEEWLVADDCPLVDPAPWRRRPTVSTPDPRVVLAGDLVRCDWPIALMERAATTGWQAANQLLAAFGRRGHELWSPPLTGLLGR